jgi:hypothetical protein
MNETEKVIFGYDPGGNRKHGVSAVFLKGEQVSSIEFTLRDSAKDVFTWFDDRGEKDPKLGIGVDTLTCWSTEASGWRPADLILSSKYPSLINSVISPNSLSGSMLLNGMSFLMRLRKKYKDLHITETHPKLYITHVIKLYFAIHGSKTLMK